MLLSASDRNSSIVDEKKSNRGDVEDEAAPAEPAPLIAPGLPDDEMFSAS